MPCLVALPLPLTSCLILVRNGDGFHLDKIVLDVEMLQIGHLGELETHMDMTWSTASHGTAQRR